MQETDAAYELLFEALNPLSGPRAILRAGFSPALIPRAFRPDPADYVCQQTWAPDAAKLTSARFQVVPQLPVAARYAAIGLVPTRQKIETLGLIARALDHLSPDGELIVCCPNELGARSYERAMRDVFAELESDSRKRCRVMRAKAATVSNRDQLQQWAAALEPKPQPDSGLLTAPGMFSCEHPDSASQLLVGLLPFPLEGSGADLGCGYGFLTQGILAGSPKVNRVVLVEAERLAIDCAQANLAGTSADLDFHWADILRWETDERFDWVVLNPPFHAGSAVQTSLGVAFLRKAAEILKPGGRLYLVANAFLPYERDLAALFSKVQNVQETGTFKVLFATR